MTADVTVLRPVLPMTTFLTGNDVPKEYQTRACAAFALWLEQLGDGNAPLALLHMAEALKAEQKRADEMTTQVARLASLLMARENGESLIEGLEKVRKRLCAYGPDAVTCDCKYGASFKGEQTGCPELRWAVAGLSGGVV